MLIMPLSFHLLVFSLFSFFFFCCCWFFSRSLSYACFIVIQNDQMLNNKSKNSVSALSNWFYSISFFFFLSLFFTEKNIHLCYLAAYSQIRFVLNLFKLRVFHFCLLLESLSFEKNEKTSLHSNSWSREFIHFICSILVFDSHFLHS